MDLENRHQPLGHEAQHDAAESGVGNDQVRPAADHYEIETAFSGDCQGRDERFHVAGFGINVRRAADSEARIPGEGNASRNL